MSYLRGKRDVFGEITHSHYVHLKSTRNILATNTSFRDVKLAISMMRNGVTSISHSVSQSVSQGHRQTMQRHSPTMAREWRSDSFQWKRLNQKDDKWDPNVNSSGTQVVFWVRATSKQTGVITNVCMSHTRHKIPQRLRRQCQAITAIQIHPVVCHINWHVITWFVNMSLLNCGLSV